MTWAAAIPAFATLLATLYNSKGEEKSTYSQSQQDLLDNSISNGPQDLNKNAGYNQGMDWLMGMFNDPEFFNNFEAPLQRQFEEETIPGLTNRFAAMGSGGSLGSTGFRNQMGREASRLQESIASLRGGMQQQGVNQLMQGAQMPINNYNDWLKTVLSPQPNNVYQPPNNPFAPIAGAAVQGWMQNPNSFGGGNPSTPTPVAGTSPLTQ